MEGCAHPTHTRTHTRTWCQPRKSTGSTRLSSFFLFLFLFDRSKCPLFFSFPFNIGFVSFRWWRGMEEAIHGDPAIPRDQQKHEDEDKDGANVRHTRPCSTRWDVVQISDGDPCCTSGEWTRNMAEEPLQMLRQYMSQGKIGDVVEDGEDVVFGGQVRIPKNTTTKLRRSKAGARKADGTKEYFTLGSLFFFIKQPPQNFSGYMKQAIAAGYQAVSLLDRNSIREYLEGKTDTLDAIEETAPLLPTSDKKVRIRICCCGFGRHTSSNNSKHGRESTSLLPTCQFHGSIKSLADAQPPMTDQRIPTRPPAVFCASKICRN